MKRPNLTKWDYKPEIEGLLIFAQALEEMLFHYTVNSFKAPALNLHTNVLELRFLANQLLKNRIKPGTILPILEELKNKLKHDPIVNNNHSSAFAVYLERAESTKNDPQELLAVCDALHAELFDFYWDELKDNIIAGVKTPRKKKNLLALAATFIAEAELQGISRSFIYYKTQKFFFNETSQPEQINAIEQISDFLENFNKEPSNWKVIFRGSIAFNKMAKYAKYFDLEIKSTFTDDMPPGFINKSFLGKSKNYPLYIICNISEKFKVLEPITARKFATSQIE